MAVHEVAMTPDTIATVRGALRMPATCARAPIGTRWQQLPSWDLLPDPATGQLGLPFVGFALFEPRPEQPKLLEE